MSAPEGHPFGILVAASATDVGAASALAQAYSDLPDGHRERLIGAVLQDAADEKVNPGPALAAFLGVESDPRLAECLQDALQHVPKSGLAPKARESAWLGRGEDGGAAIVDPMYGSFVMFWALRWRGSGEVDPVHSEMTTVETAAEWLASEPAMMPAPREQARAAMVEALWRHRVEFGQLPQRSTAFAHLL